MNFLFLLALVLFQPYIDLIKIENLLISIGGYWTGDQNCHVLVKKDLHTRKTAVEGNSFRCFKHISGLPHPLFLFPRIRHDFTKNVLFY